MARRRKTERGRPLKRGYPPRLDATAAEIAEAVLSAPAGKVAADPAEYRCRECGRVVEYPAVLGRDGRCEGCGIAH